MEAIQFDKVHFSYEEADGEGIFAENSVFSLCGIDLTVQEGEFVAILGHNGSGKSTLARLSNGLLLPEEGKITVFGMDTADEKQTFSIREKVGIVFQNPDNQTVATIVEDDIAFGPENVGVPRKEIGERIEFALNTVGMQAYRNSPVSKLSGGQKQRVAIAGVLALKPKVMILDEATAMLDPKGRKEVMDVVCRLNKEENITVIVITHFPEEALLADRAVVMNRGRIVMQGKPQEILAREEELNACSLVLPKSVELCRRLQERGVSIPDCYAVNEVAEALASRLQQGVYTDGQAVIGGGNESEAGRIVCENLHYTYDGASAFESHALNGVNLVINSGDFFGIIGHTGSGKSTFVQHLNALIKLPTAEKRYKEKKKKKAQEQTTLLKVSAFDLTQKTTDFTALRKNVGMVFQYPEYQLFAETVFDDVAFGLKNFQAGLSQEETETAVREAIQTVGLNYEEIKDRSPFDLSGGQRRRVAIAGVIVTKPEILVLDEPSAGLDPLGKKEMMSLLHAIHDTWCKTVIVVSHDMDEVAENCNKIALFAGGKALAVESPNQLFSTDFAKEEGGLDLPFIAKLTHNLKEKGVDIRCRLTLSAFVDAVAKGVAKDE